MTNSKSTKRALLTSAMSILLCVSMLLGTTFAWFTDSVTSANNIIKSGNLDVEFEYWDGDSWETVKDASDILTNELWEPGVTEIAYLRVANAGSLALKYQLGVNIVSEKEGTNVAGDTFKLSDSIMFGVVENITEGTYSEDDAGRAAAIAAVTDAKKINVGYTKEFEIEAEADKDYFALVVYMPTKVGNEANHKGEGFEPSIDLGINVYATQLNSEEDSFGSDYDAGLVPTTSDNGTERELADGSTVFYYNEESGYGGRVRLTALPENLDNEYIVPADVNDLGGALVGVTLEELTIPSGVQFAQKSLEGATIDEVVLAEGTTTIPNRLFYKANIGSVKIPSSITVIEENAFAQASNVTSLIIPASVTTVEEAAFQHMTNLTTVTFEGNTSIQGYAFRGCANLRTVNLNGDDVTFIASTLNGRNSCWFCNGESNNPGTSNITFNVINDTVAARVKTAMGAECPEDTTKSTVKIYVNGAENYIGTKQ